MATADFETPRDTSYLDPKTPTVQRKPEPTSELKRLAAQVAGITQDPGMYNQVGQELLAGDQTTVNQVKDAVRGRKKEEAKPVIRDILQSEITLNDKAAQLAEVSRQTEEVSLAEEFELSTVQNAKATGQAAQEQQALKEQRLTTRESNAKFFKEYFGKTVDFNENERATKILEDVVATLALPGYFVNLSEVLTKSNPNLQTDATVISGGTLLEDYITALDEMPEAEAKETLKQLVHAINDNKFFGVENGYLKYDLFNTVLDGLESQDVPVVLYNVLSVIDLIPILEAARGAYFGIKTVKALTKEQKVLKQVINEEVKAPGSVSRELDQNAPEDSAAVHSAILKSGDEAAAEVLGTDLGTTVIVNAAFKAPDVPRNIAPDINESIEKKLHYNGTNQIFTAEEKAIAMTRVQSDKYKLLAAMPDIHLNKSVVREVDGGYEFEAVMAPNYRGFTTLNDALQFVKTIDDDLYDGMEVLVEDSRTGLLEKLDDVPFENRDGYYLQAIQKQNFNTEDAVALNPVTGEGLTGQWAKWGTKAASFAKSWTRGGDIVDQFAAKEKALNQILTPLSTLGGKAQRKVLDLIDEGDVERKWFTRDDMAERWQGDPDLPKLVKGYEAFLAFHKQARQLLNDAAYAEATSKNLKHIRVPLNTADEIGDRLGKLINTLPKGVNRVYDPELRAIRQLSEDEIKELSEASGGLIELTGPMNVKGTFTPYVLNKGGAEVKPLPRQILRDDPGYVTRTYEANYFIKQTMSGEGPDGGPFETSVKVMMARDKGNAQAYADNLNTFELKRPGDPGYYRVEEVAELGNDRVFADRTGLEYFEEYGELFFSPRGKEMMGIRGDRIVQPISNRLETFRRSAASAGTIDFAIQKFTRNWEKEFGEEFGLKGRFSPFAKIPAPRIKDDLGRRRQKDAIAAQNYIKMLMGVDDTMLSNAVHNSAVFIADKLATPSTRTPLDRFRNRAAETALNSRRGKLLDVPKQLAFLQWIALNPARQLVLQAQQASVYLSDKGALKYFASGKGFKEYLGLVQGLSTRDTALWEASARTQSKVLGMSVEEYTEFVDAVRVTGLMDNVDSHAFTSIMTIDRSMGGGEGLANLKHASAETFKTVVRAARAVGFDAGEKAQLLSAFLVKKNRWQIENPGKAKQWAKGQNLTEIATGAREISFGMNQADILQFQKGALGTIFQFMSHNTKALQVLIPQKALGKTVGKLSNKSFSDRQRAALLATQSVMYGTGFAGLYGAYDKIKEVAGVEPPEEIDRLIKEGIFGTGMNMMFSLADNPDQEISTDLDVSGRVAPFSGVTSFPATRLIETQFLTDLSLTDIPGFSTGKGIYDAVKVAGYLTGVGILDTLDIDQATGLPNDESVSLQVLNTMARLIPTYNNVVKARASLAVERFATNSGSLKVQATAGEILGNASFGFQAVRRREVEQALRTLTGTFNEPEEKALKSELDDQARYVYNTAMKIIQQGGGDGIAVLEELEQTVQALSMVDRMLYSEFDWDYIYKQKMPDLLFNAPVTTEDAKLNDLPESELVEGMIKLVDKQKLETTDSALEAIKNFTDFEGKQYYVDWLEDIRE